MARADTPQPKKPRRAPIATAPRDGSLVRVALRASEQGPAELDTVRWAKSASSGQEGWVAFDSDPQARVVYSDGELAYWLPLPQSGRTGTPAAQGKTGDERGRERRLRDLIP